MEQIIEIGQCNFSVGLLKIPIIFHAVESRVVLRWHPVLSHLIFNGTYLLYNLFYLNV